MLRSPPSLLLSVHLTQNLQLNPLFSRNRLRHLPPRRTIDTLSGPVKSLSQNRQFTRCPVTPSVWESSTQNIYYLRRPRCVQDMAPIGSVF